MWILSCQILGSWSFPGMWLSHLEIIWSFGALLEGLSRQKWSSALSLVTPLVKQGLWEDSAQGPGVPSFSRLTVEQALSLNTEPVTPNPFPTSGSSLTHLCWSLLNGTNWTLKGTLCDPRALLCCSLLSSLLASHPHLLGPPLSSIPHSREPPASLLPAPGQQAGVVVWFPASHHTPLPDVLHLENGLSIYFCPRLAYVRWDGDLVHGTASWLEKAPLYFIVLNCNS